MTATLIAAVIIEQLGINDRNAAVMAVTHDEKIFDRFDRMFKPDPDLQAAVTTLPRQLATLVAPDIKSAAAWRTFELNPMMGVGMMGMRGGRGQTITRTASSAI